jgi:hypothetical protein
MDTQAHSWSISFQSDSDSLITASVSEFSLAADESISIQFDYRSLGGIVNEYRYADILINDEAQFGSTVRLTMVVKIADDLIFSNGFDSI